MIKKIIAYTVVLLPTFILIAILGNISINVVKINSGIGLSDIGSLANDYLCSQGGELASLYSDGVFSYEYTYNYPFGEKRFERSLDLSPNDANYNIYVYGSSPVVSKPPVFGKDFKTFSEFVEDNLNSVKVYNLGLTSADSFCINEIVKASVDVHKPNLIIYYYGGGIDYESAYYVSQLKVKHYPLTVLPARFIDNLFPAKGGTVWGRVRYYAGWFNRTYIQPYLISFLQRMEILNINPEVATKLNSIVLEDIENNINTLVAFTQKENIPIIFITSLSNLEARPFGTNSVTRFYYVKGMDEKDNRKKYEYLVKARDSELFTGDIGPKSGVNNIFREISNGKENVFTLDIETKYVDNGEGFGYKYFYDYGHMKPNLHEKIAKEIVFFAKENEIVFKN